MMVIIFNVLYLAEFGLVFLHQSLLVLFQLLHPLCQRINLNVQHGDTKKRHISNEVESVYFKKN